MIGRPRVDHVTTSSTVVVGPTSSGSRWGVEQHADRDQLDDDCQGDPDGERGEQRQGNSTMSAPIARTEDALVDVSGPTPGVTVAQLSGLGGSGDARR